VPRDEADYLIDRKGKLHMDGTFRDAVEVVYWQSCRNFRDNPDEERWDNLCCAIEECYPEEVERIRNRDR
jgi:hypothetical protein